MRFPLSAFWREKLQSHKGGGVDHTKKGRLWLPVSAYLIECSKGKILVDTGWSREMSPDGVYNRSAQIRHMSLPLYFVNQGEIAKGEAVHEQLRRLGIDPGDLDYVCICLWI